MFASLIVFKCETRMLAVNLVNNYVSRETILFLRCCIVGRLFVACPRSPDICLSVCLTLDCVQFD